jgi:hypothetical protein
MGRETPVALRQNEQVIGEDLVASLDKRSAEARFSVARLTQKSHGSAVDADDCRMEWFESLLDESEGERLPEQIGVDRLARMLTKGPTQDQSAIG